MIRIEHSVEIKRPVEAVWSYMAVPQNTTQWQAGVLVTEPTTEGPVGVGTKIRIVRQFLGRRIETVLDTTEYEPNVIYAFKSVSGPISVEGSVGYESVEGGTKVKFAGRGEPGGFFKLAEPLIARLAKRQAVNDSSTLKDLLEAHVEGGP